MKGLLVDFGGVLTTNVFDAFRDFCEDEGLDPDAVRRLFREDPRALECVRGIERGELSEDDFGERFGELLGLEPSAAAVSWSACSATSSPTRRWSRRCAAPRAQGVRTGLISNSMGAGRYDRSTFPELFDGVVISGDEGMPSRSRRSTSWAASGWASRPPSACSSTTCARTARAPRRSA